MKKKLLLVAIFLLLLVLGSALWIRHLMGVTDPAALLPSDAVGFIALPDLPRSALRWPQTTLAKIGAEPEMKAFIEKPLQFLTKNQGGEEAGSLLWKLKPGRLFAAVTTVTDKDAALIIGFQYWGGKIGHDAAVERLRQELSAGGPPPPLNREIHEGTEIVSSVHQGFTLYNASHGQWGFLSNNLTAIKDAVDRAAGRRKDTSLADSPRYKSILSRLARDPDLLFFCQPQSTIEALLEIGKGMGAHPIPEQVEQARKVEAVGFATKLEGANLRDTIFILRPNPPDFGSLNRSSMKFTSEATAVFFNFVVNFQQLSALSRNPLLASAMKSDALQNSKIIEIAPEAFGPECAVSISWKSPQMWPEGVFAIQVKDQAKADQAMQEAVALFPEANVVESEGIKFYSFPALTGPLTNPTFALAEGYLLTGFNADSINQAVAQAKANAPLDKTPAFAPAISALKSANETFGYVDSKMLFERGFPQLRQLVIFSAALMPGASDVIDPSKLPETETIARHLQPITYAQTRLADGYYIESTGPITMNQAIILGAGLGSSFFRPPQ